MTNQDQIEAESRPSPMGEIVSHGCWGQQRKTFATTFEIFQIPREGGGVILEVICTRCRRVALRVDNPEMIKSEG